MVAWKSLDVRLLTMHHGRDTGGPEGPSESEPVRLAPVLAKRSRPSGYIVDAIQALSGTRAWIQMQYLIFACIAHTAVCAIHKYPKYPVSAVLPKCKYPQYMQYMTYCMPISRPSVHNA